MRYIELNPVRASLVSHPGDYRWSSYACNTVGKPSSLICKHVLYRQLGSDGLKQQIAYRELFRDHLDKDDKGGIRESLNQELVLGRDDFKENIKRLTKRQVKPAKMGRPRIEEETNGIFKILEETVI